MINRTDTSYIDLPEQLHERRCKTAKMQISITINCPPSLDRKYKKYIDDVEAYAAKEFQTLTKKIAKK